jgi:hypothetical protein
MGGHALKSVITRRIERDEYIILSEKIKSIVLETFERAGIPRCLNNKPDFGDIDVVISLKTIHPIPNIRDYIKSTFNPREIFHNGPCWSFDYQNVQVDFIFSEPEHFDSTYIYMGLSDVSNYIGVIARGFGLKYGQVGLSIEHEFKGRRIGEIIISKDYQKIFNYLGFDYETFERGFDDLEDVFKYVANSKYFNWKKFQFSELNAENKNRNKRRDSYNSFLKWIDENVADESHEYQFALDKSRYFNGVNCYFPEANLVLRCRELEYLECRQLYAQAKFNGGVIIKKYGFTGKELGELLAGFKIFMSGPDHIYQNFEDYVVESDLEIILKDFDFYLKHKYGK